MKAGAAPSREAALALAGAILEPSLIVDSGYGYQPWWLLEDGPWRFADDADRDRGQSLTRRWGTAHRQRVPWGLDPVGDHARLMRLPGTTNGKGAEPVPVTVVEHGGKRYAVDELLEIVADVPDAPSAPCVEVGDIECGVPVGDERISELTAATPRFAATFRHERDVGDGSPTSRSTSRCAGWLREPAGPTRS